MIVSLNDHGNGDPDVISTQLFQSIRQARDINDVLLDDVDEFTSKDEARIFSNNAFQVLDE